ncbi:MAG: hypothetical protein JW776_08375 [Candidatus Lokiarchaeota archaeon]|nr:hypothetical protein [Candidatus Lokiarchaeota archaeon]
MKKLKCYLTSPVFREIAEHPKVSDEKKQKITELWDQLKRVTELKISGTRFPSEEEITDAIQNWGAEILGCHLSHPITSKMLQNSNIVAVCTCTAGYNHISQEPGVIITHTPGVLHNTVANFAIAAILSNLRNIVGLHNFVWNGEWKASHKWDLDENLSAILDNLMLGIVGMGEIGKEVTKRLYPWGVKILYYDINQQLEFEIDYPNLKFVSSLEEIFTQSDIISLHIPLSNSTYHIINAKLLKLMKKGALLVNTARGDIINFDDLLNLMEKDVVSINLVFDVFEQEPIDNITLDRFRQIQNRNPELKFIFIPHNSSADADTRAQMAIMFLTDLITVSMSSKMEDLQNLKLIPEIRKIFQSGKEKALKISRLWEQR